MTSTEYDHTAVEQAIVSNGIAYATLLQATAIEKSLLKLLNDDAACELLIEINGIRYPLSMNSFDNCYELLETMNNLKQLSAKQLNVEIPVVKY